MTKRERKSKPSQTNTRPSMAAQRSSFTHMPLKGYSIRLSEKEAIKLSQDSRVDYVEQDQVMSLSTTQSSATWGLDRVDQRNLPLNGTYTYNYNGTGIHAYIIDTGIYISHTDFGGRASVAHDSVGDGQNGIDCNGHGTHVSGTVGGATYGVAKNVTLHAVRVLNCSGSGTNSGVIDGVNWVASNHLSPAVANMSLGGGLSSALDSAVSSAISSGVTFAIAAGNGDANGVAQDACTTSPADVAAAITVGATDSSDSKTSFSNYGTCVDIFAPGLNITSDWDTSTTATNTISGTSMATPHVAGVAALYLQSNPSASPATVASAITSTATANVLTNIGSGSPNKLLYSLLSGTPTPTPTPVPTTCSGYTSTYTGSLSGTGASQAQPNGTYYYSGVSGYQKGKLIGPTSADFDLYLYKWNGTSWVTVASSASSTSNETISYYGSSGYYYWEIYSYSGSGSYTFCLSHP